MAMHWYKEVHGECVSQSYRLHELDDIGDDFDAAKKAAFHLLDAGDTLLYGDPSDARYLYGDYMVLQTVKYAAKKKRVRVEDMPNGKLPWYAKPEKGYHYAYYWYDDNEYKDGFYLELLPREEILDGRGHPFWEGR